MPSQRNDTSLRESILELHVNAALAGHDLGSFERVENGYQARCRRCGQTAWVGEMPYDTVPVRTQ